MNTSGLTSETRTRPSIGVAAPLAILLVGFALAVRTMTGSPGADTVSADESRLRHDRVQAALPLHLEPVTSPEEAVLRTSLPPAGRDALLAAVKAGRIRLAWLPIFDSDAVDGDQVKVSGDGLSQTVTLTHDPIPLLVAVPADGKIMMTGVDEGRGGGVTVGVVSGGKILKLVPFVPGETRVMPSIVP